MDYPKRDKFFAHKFARLIFRTCLANEIGPESCYLLLQIAHTEDAGHYRKSVTFFNEQLIGVCGFGSVPSLIRARQRAINAGWLHYQPGGKGRPGRYHVLVPEWVTGLPDGSVEHDFPSDCSNKHLGQAEDKRSESGGQAEDKRSESGGQAEDKRSESVNHSSLSPSLPLSLSPSSAAQKKRAQFTKPSVDEVRTYCSERQNQITPELFLAYYESNGWRVGRNPMKDWQAAIRTWEKNGVHRTPKTADPRGNFAAREAYLGISANEPQ